MRQALRIARRGAVGEGSKDFIECLRYMLNHVVKYKEYSNPGQYGVARRGPCCPPLLLKKQGRFFRQ